MSIEQYQYTINCRKISGLDEIQEENCRTLVKIGMDWINNNPNISISLDQLENLFGNNNIDNNSDIYLLKELLIQSIENVNDTMLQISMSHIVFAHNNGWENYINLLESY